MSLITRYGAETANSPMRDFIAYLKDAEEELGGNI
jgi:hypothetical protein